jgi:hypothetical protein
VLKKKITYENPFTEQKVTEEFWFHISKADMVRLEVEEHKERYVAKDGVEYTGMQAKLHRIVEAEDGKAMMPIFEDIIRRSYGRRDGDRFMRTEEIWQDFKGSGAFDELLFELCTDAEGSASFINNIFPKNLDSVADEVAARVAAQEAAKKPAAKKKPAKKAANQAELADPEERKKIVEAATTDNPVELTQDELVAMDPSDLQTGLAGGKYKFPGSA